MRARAGAALLLAAALAACASPVKLGSAQLAREREPAPVPVPGAPRVYVAPVEDRRADPSALGQVAGRAVSSTDVAGWVERELDGLASSAYAVVKGPGAAAGARLALYPRVLKAYVSSQNVTKTAVLVLEVELVAPDGARETRLYRGQDTGMNWASGEGEIVTALQEAAARCVGQLRGDLEARLAPPAAPAAGAGG